MNHRRGFLLGVLGLGAAPGALAITEEPMNVPTERVLAGACHDRTQHARLLAEFAAKLTDVDEAARKRLIDAATCPFCSCRLAVQD
jgi:hypothetical protein